MDCTNSNSESLLSSSVDKRLVIEHEHVEIHEFDQFCTETKIREIVYELVQSKIIDSNKTMIETTTQTNELLRRVKLLEKRLKQQKKEHIIVILSLIRRKMLLLK